MSIQEMLIKINRGLRETLFVSVKEWVPPLILCLVGLISFGLGRLSALEESRPAVRVFNAPEATVADLTLVQGGQVFSTPYGRTYYAPWCLKQLDGKGTLRSYPSAEIAKKRGLTPAKGCPGLE